MKIPIHVSLLLKINLNCQKKKRNDIEYMYTTLLMHRGIIHIYSTLFQ